MAAVEDEIIDTAVESVQPINGRFLHSFSDLGVHFWLTDLSQCLHFRIPPGPTKTPGRRVTTPTGWRLAARVRWKTSLRFARCSSNVFPRTMISSR
ncbi:uncharacterized protein LOC143265883 isoform X4 [Megachile rotundata]|uniref:uncharacterized protein LOC143265883 isoform X4 n=1 Tax=Megachile rotundata TaxID=143995 RepID=UPI003FD00D2A